MSVSDDSLLLTTLGSLSIRDSDGALLAEESKPLLILAFLAAQPDGRAPRDHVADLLWPGADVTRRKRSLRQALHTLRKAGADAVVTAKGGDLILNVERLRVDVWELEELVADGAYDEAVELIGGPFLDSVRSKTSPELAHWAEAEDARIEVVVDRAFRLAIERRLQRGENRPAVALARRWVRFNPLAEPRVLTLIDALLTEGETLEALQEARRFRTLIEAELGDTPSPAFQELEHLAEEGRRRPAASGAPPRTPRRRRVGASLAFAAVVVTGALVALARREPEPAITLAAAAGDVPGTLTMTASGVTFREGVDLPAPPTVPSPVGGETAHTVSTADGTDLEVVDSTGVPLLTLASPADEAPLDWSPDGERLLYRRGWYDVDQGRYRVAIGSWHRATGETHEFEVDGFDGRLTATWSPDGARIAIGGGPRLLLATAGGAILSETEAHGHVGTPRWSTSGVRLAVDVWDGTPADVHLYQPATIRLVPLVRTPGDERDLVWLNHRFLVAISVLDGRRHLVLMDAVNGSATLVQEDVPVTRLSGAPAGPIPSDVIEDLHRAWTGASRARFIDSLHVESPSTRLGVGEYVVYEASPVGPDGTTIVGPPSTPDWMPHSARLVRLGPGLFRAVTSGPETVTVSYPGWRAASFSVEISEAERRGLTPVWRETWAAGWRGRWLVFGDPDPRVVAIDDVTDVAFAFESLGDQSYASGAMTRRRFATAEGLTVELWSRSPFTRQLFQHWGIGLRQRAVDPPPPPSWSHTNAESWVSLVAEDRRVLMAGLDPTYRIPLPDSTGAWRRYALQVSPSGEQILFVDGRAHVRAQASPGWASGDSARIILSGQAVGTEILHGPVGVFEGELYGWPEWR